MKTELDKRTAPDAPATEEEQSRPAALCAALDKRTAPDAPATEEEQSRPAALCAALEELQGSWKVVALELDGQKMPQAMLGGAKIVITGETFQSLGMGAVYDGAIVVDESASPKTFDLIYKNGPEAGARSLGIYELDGNTWRACFTLRAGTRPTEFATTPGSGLALDILEREG